MRRKRKRAVPVGALRAKAARLLSWALHDPGQRAALARSLRITPAEITQRLDGKRNMTLDTVEEMAAALGCEVVLALRPRALPVTPPGAATMRTDATAVPVIWHDDLEALHAAMWQTTPEDLAASDWGGITADGREVSLTYAQMLDGMREQGAWGYYDTNRHEIHAWLATDCDTATAIHFLAHERAHAEGLDVDVPAGVADEARAERVGEIARWAYELAAARLGKVTAAACGGRDADHDG